MSRPVSPASSAALALLVSVVLPLFFFAAAGCSRPAAVNDDATARALGELNDAAPEIRLRAVEELGRQRAAAAVRPLCRCLRDIRLDVRKAAAQALGGLKDPAAVGPLSATLAGADEDSELRKLAAEALGQIGDASGVPALAAALRDADEGVVYAAAYALANAGGEPALAELVAATRGDNPVARRAAVNVLGNAPSTAVVERLRELVTDADPVVRLAAGERLVRLRDTASYDTVIDMLLDPDPTVRLGIRPSVSSMGRQAPMDALCRILALRTDAVERTDPAGKAVKVPVGDARDIARDLALSATGPAIIRPVLIVAAGQKSGADEGLRNRLKAQLGDPAFRSELYRLIASGSPSEQPLGLQVLSDYFGEAVRERGDLRDRKQVLDELGFADTAEVANLCAKALQSDQSVTRYLAARILCQLGDTRGRKELVGRFRAAVDELKQAWAEAELAWSSEEQGLNPEELKKAEAERIQRRIEKAKRDGRAPSARVSRGGSTPEQAAVARRLAALSKATPRAAIDAANQCLTALYGVCDKSLVDELRPAIDLGDPRIASWAEVLSHVIRMMGKVADPGYADQLLGLLMQDGRASVLLPALADALGTLKVAAAFDPLAEFVRAMVVDQYHVWLRRPCYEGLFRCDPERAVEVIGSVLTNMPAHQAGSIEVTADTLGKHPDARSVPYLTFWVNHDLREVRDAVQEALQQVGRKNLGWLIEGFDVADEPRRSALAGVIADGFGRDAVARLQATMTNANPRIRQGAVWTLGCVGGPEAVEAVRRGLADAHPGVRSAAAWSVGRLPAAELAADLVKLLADGDETVRAMAARQLGTVGGGEAVDPLVGALADKAATVRAQAALSLGALNAAAALPALDKLAGHDPDPEVNTAAKLAAARVRGSAAPPPR